MSESIALVTRRFNRQKTKPAGRTLSEADAESTTALAAAPMPAPVSRMQVHARGQLWRQPSSTPATNDDPRGLCETRGGEETKETGAGNPIERSNC